ncbi:hypothetical protein MIR68_004069 [Amoeboaphelidium protococcarum]|nr:hypothetical protein MIR68_004069 [Amoeboaphelidium protococcarum]
MVLDANLRMMKLNLSLIFVIVAHIITLCFGNLFASEYTPLLGELSQDLRHTQGPMWNKQRRGRLISIMNSIMSSPLIDKYCDSGASSYKQYIDTGKLVAAQSNDDGFTLQCLLALMYHDKYVQSLKYVVYEPHILQPGQVPQNQAYGFPLRLLPQIVQAQQLRDVELVIPYEYLDEARYPMQYAPSIDQLAFNTRDILINNPQLEKFRFNILPYQYKSAVDITHGVFSRQCIYNSRVKMLHLATRDNIAALRPLCMRSLQQLDIYASFTLMNSYLASNYLVCTEGAESNLQSLRLRTTYHQQNLMIISRIARFSKINFLVLEYTATQQEDVYEPIDVTHYLPEVVKFVQSRTAQTYIRVSFLGGVTTNLLYCTSEVCKTLETMQGLSFMPTDEGFEINYNPKRAQQLSSIQ